MLFSVVGSHGRGGVKGFSVFKKTETNSTIESGNDGSSNGAFSEFRPH